MLPAALSLLIGLQLAHPALYHASDLSRFPDREAAEEAYAFARARAEFVEANPPLWAYRRDGWYALRRRCEWETEPWRYLAWAHQAEGGQRMYYLDQLRERIGEAAYAMGAMPLFGISEYE